MRPNPPGPRANTSSANTTLRIWIGNPTEPISATATKATTRPRRARTYRATATVLRISLMLGIPDDRAALRDSTRTSANSTTRTPAALTQNATAGPAAATVMPPSIGPISRELLNCAEFKVTALRRSSRGTSSLTKACQTGRFRPPASPEAAASAT